MFLSRLGEPRCVLHVQAHPAVVHEPEVIADALAHLTQHFEIFLQSRVAFRRAMVQRHLSADEAHLLSKIGARSRGVKAQLVAHRTTQ